MEQKIDVEKTQPTEEAEGIYALNPMNSRLDTPVAVPKIDPLASPTKGILLTPGTGPTRRKTVSFGSLMADAQEKEGKSLSTEATSDPASKRRKDPEVLKSSPKIQPRQSSLTKTLIQLSKQHSNSQAVSMKPIEEERASDKVSSMNAQTQNPDHDPDNTVDLSQPRSRSGQHWKTEYDQFHKRSNREMKRMIMYGQNVKSYAVKKDSEATCLGEKLKRELAKVAAMEKKVSKLAAQLNNVYAHGPEGESEQTRLVSELAQQTALAIRYKQKADHYKRAMQKENDADGSDGERDRVQVPEEVSQETNREGDSPEVISQSAEQGTLQAQLETLRMSAKRAEDQAAKLEAENSALKRSLARVKGEMMSYEARRQAREERYKRREAKCRADQKACEVQLAELTVEHQNLLLASRQPTNGERIINSKPTIRPEDHRGRDMNAKPSERALADNKAKPEPVGQSRVSKPYISPRKGRLQRATVDIWTLSSPRDAVDNISPSKEPTELAPSSVRHDIQRTLKEIDQNLISERLQEIKPDGEQHISQPDNAHTLPTNTIPQPQPQPRPQSEMTHNQNPAFSSPKPAKSDNPTPKNPATIEYSDTIVKPTVKHATATIGRSASLMSRVGGSRTSTMTSVRGSALSAERAAAAKARLAARSAEKRKGEGGRG